MYYYQRYYMLLLLRVKFIINIQSFGMVRIDQVNGWDLSKDAVAVAERPKTQF